MNRSVVRKIAGALFILAGLIALWFAISLFKMDEGSFPQNLSYGGDAYTGMQNAAASAARNVKWLYELVAKGFGAILLVLSFAMFGFGVKSFAPVPVSAPSDPAPTASSGKWLCPHCLTPNEMKSRVCVKCGAPRGALKMRDQ